MTDIQQLEPVATALTPMEAARNLVEIEKQIKALETQKKALKKQLFDVMKQNDTLQLKTGSYTIYRASRAVPKPWNLEAALKDLKARNIPYYLTFDSSMNTVFKELAKQGKPIAGVDLNESEYVAIKVTK